MDALRAPLPLRLKPSGEFLRAAFAAKAASAILGEQIAPKEERSVLRYASDD